MAIKEKLIYIKWCDAIGKGGDVWCDKDEAIKWAKTDAWNVEQIGWILDETKEYLLTASRKSVNSDGTIDWGDIFKLPKTWIRKRIDLSKNV